MAEMMTADGLERLKAELNKLVSVDRPEIAERIKDAIALGDLSENSDYEDAKHRQAFIEGRIAEVTAKIRNAQLITEATDNSIIGIGSRVTVDSNEGRETFTILGPFEADPARGRISHLSPLGRVLLGRKVGERVVAQAPGGAFEYVVADIG